MTMTMIASDEMMMTGIPHWIHAFLEGDWSEEGGDGQDVAMRETKLGRLVTVAHVPAGAFTCTSSGVVVFAAIAF